MIAIIAILTSLAYSYLAYVLFVDAWTRDLDFDTDDRGFMLFSSAFGPLSFLAAIFIWCALHRNHPVRIITPRKG